MMEFITPKEQARHRDYFLAQFPGHQTFQTFDDTPAKRKHLARIFQGHNPRELNHLNFQDAGVFLTINETDGMGRTANNIIRVRAVFADLDGAPVEPVREYHPHMLIESSPGKYHAYWLTHDTLLEGFTQLQESIAEKFNSDPKVKDLPRVMRVPGYYWCKKPDDVEFMTRIVSINKRPALSFRQLTEMFPPKPVKMWTGEKYRPKVFSHTASGEYRGQYGAGEGERNNSLIKIIGGMIKRGLSWHQIETEAFKHGMACSPPLTEKEILHTLRSGRRYA
jgi:hypothetical protein